jgi:hypothetical protein
MKIYSKLINTSFFFFFYLVAFAQNDKTYHRDPELFSENIGTNAFIKANYLEIGVSGKGCLVSTAAPPANYHKHAQSVYLGMVSDNAKNGWTVGTPPQSGDYFEPGVPFEGFKVEFNGITYENNANVTTIGIPGANQTIADTPELKKALWQGEKTGLFSLSQTVEVGNDNTYAVFKIVLTNLSSSSANIYYSRAVDPDQENHTGGGGASTINTIVSQYSSGVPSLVRAIGRTHGLYFGMMSNDPRSKVCFTGFTWSLTPSQYYSGSNGAVLSGTSNADYATAITFYFPNVPPSSSVTFEYAFLTNQSDEALYSCNPTATISGNQSILAGNSANLNVSFTGNSPWNFTMNGQTYSGITTNPYTVSVTPSTTTTYTLSDVNNTCGTGVVSGSATVTVCQPSELAGGSISGSQTINPGQSANLTLNFTGPSPWTAVVNGVTIPNISLTPFTYTVSPSTTTTYTLTSVSNLCGTATTNSSAIITVCNVSTAILSGSQTIVSGGTANLSVAFTGPSPWNLNFNGQSYTNITTSPLIISVTPTTTTTYNLTSVSNVCGTGTVSGTATVTICHPPNATISGNQSITSGQTANLNINLSGSSPWSFVVNGINYSNVTTNPQTISVTPTTTTTYILTSVSNTCGFNAATSSATVTVVFDANAGLMSCYAFSNNMVDGVGRNNGTNTGASLTTDRFNKSNHAYNFNGNEYITIPTNGLLNNSYTYSLWVNPASLPSLGQAYTMLGIGGQTMLLMYSTFYNRIVWNYISYSTSSSVSSLVTPDGFTILANQWIHFVAVKNGSITKMYINGQLVATGSISGTPDYSGDGFIGKRSGANFQNMYGKVDDIRIYNTALDDSQIAQLTALGQNENCDAYTHIDNGLVSCYAFSSDAKDEFAGNHGTLSNPALTNDRFNTTTSAYNFGGSDYISSTGNGMLNNNNYTYSAWVNPSSLPASNGFRTIIAIGDTQVLMIGNHANTGNVPAWYFWGYESTNPLIIPYVSYPVSEANKWYHVVAMRTNTEYKIYVDGVLKAQKSTSNPPLYTQNIQLIGSRSTTINPNYWLGKIDDIRIYNRAITDDEVKTLRYTKGCRTKCPDITSITTPYTSPLQPLRIEANQINGTNVINPTTEIRYDASKSVILNAGFKVEQGAVFEALINGCGSDK